MSTTRLWYLLLFVLLCLVFSDGALNKGALASKQHKVTLLKFFKLNSNAVTSNETVSQKESSSSVETSAFHKKGKLHHCREKCDPSTGIHKTKRALKIAKNKTSEIKKSHRPYDDNDDGYERYPEDEEFSDESTERTRDDEVDDRDHERRWKHRPSDDEEETALVGRHGHQEDDYVDASSNAWDWARPPRHQRRGEKWWGSSHSAISEDEDDYDRPRFSHRKFHPRLSVESSYYDDDSYEGTRPRFHSSHKSSYSDDDTYDEPKISRPRYYARIYSSYSNGDSDDEPSFSSHRFRPRMSSHSGNSDDDDDDDDNNDDDDGDDSEDETRYTRLRFRPTITFYGHRRRYPHYTMYTGYRRYGGQAMHVWPSTSQGYQRSSLMPLPDDSPYNFRSFGPRPAMQQAWQYPVTRFPPNPFNAQLVRPGIAGYYPRNMFAVPHNPSSAFFIPPHRRFSPAYQTPNLRSLGVPTSGSLPGIESTLDKFAHLYHPQSVASTKYFPGQYFRNFFRPHHEFPEAVLNTLRDLNLQRRAIRSILQFADCFRPCGF